MMTRIPYHRVFTENLPLPILCAAQHQREHNFLLPCAQVHLPHGNHIAHAVLLGGVIELCECCAIW